MEFIIPPNLKNHFGPKFGDLCKSCDFNTAKTLLMSGLSAHKVWATLAWTKPVAKEEDNLHFHGPFMIIVEQTFKMYIWILLQGFAPDYQWPLTVVSEEKQVGAVLVTVLESACIMRRGS